MKIPFIQRKKNKMGDFLDAVTSVLKSDFAKDNRVLLVALISVSVIVTAVVVSLIFNKLIIPYKLRVSGDVTSEYQKVLLENVELKEKLKSYRNIKNMTEAIEAECPEEQEDKALNTFLRKSK